ncbi:CRISPR system precrRNA processing endoribonuclease RAMP protein Cas6 [Bacillus sp. 3103sda1]|uniref:CRISPR system precrRNA processing endoribonuclease RAMP protein Cas6 n=1 Tax=Bacillus sp. 3103sda1 TaxID=2953808 RepID=UPI00209F8A2C|nr:CRISPR system precrRNA processing endoribonuclease RAMP protein Cas6 [Bacillus sp. 3103sda1]MCP1123843.1 CRISPR system precrRNA processing endoribonuclease RAMP protein Cas6 [Bacillus sp. 3103sda1]
MANIEVSSLVKIKLQAIKLRITIQALDSGAMPKNSSSIFRGMWGREIRKRTCIYPNLSCEKCSYMLNCAYGSIFEPISAVFAPELAFQTRYLSPPLVVEAPVFNEEFWSKGQEKQLEIILFGENSSYARYFVDTLDIIGKQYGIGSKRIKFHISKVEHVSKAGFVTRVTSSQLKDDQLPVEWWGWKEPTHEISQVMIQIQTPTRLLKSGYVIRDMDAEVFLQTCVRRTQYLCKLYGEIKHPLLKEDLNDIINSIHCSYAEGKWEDWHRYSAKQQKSMNLGGVVGMFQLQGDLKKLVPYLQCGSFSHIGKQTVFGLGKYKVWIPAGTLV